MAVDLISCSIQNIRITLFQIAANRLVFWAFGDNNAFGLHRRGEPARLPNHKQFLQRLWQKASDGFRLGKRTSARRPRRLTVLAVSLCVALLALPGTVFSKVPRGVFCLLPSGKVGKARTFINPDVDGISIRQDWSELEPAQDVYDWGYLDMMVAKAAAGGKKVLLRIGTSGGDAALGGSTPTWVFNAVKAEALPASQKFFTFRNGKSWTTIPVFWDKTYLAKKKAMITALGAHFTGNPAVKIVSASFANANSEDWGVPHTAPEVTAWLNAGYTSDKLISAGKQIIDATMTAFPNQYVTLAVGGNGHAGATGNLDPDDSYVARNAVLNARATWPGRLIVQKNTLAKFIPPAPGIGTLWELLWNSGPDVAGQMVYWCYGDTTYRVNSGVAIAPSIALRKSIDNGVAYGMKYIEIYHTDVLNLPTVVNYAHIALALSQAGTAQDVEDE